MGVGGGAGDDTSPAKVHDAYSVACPLLGCAALLGLLKAKDRLSHFSRRNWRRRRSLGHQRCRRRR